MKPSPLLTSALLSVAATATTAAGRPLVFGRHHRRLPTIQRVHRLSKTLKSSEDGAPTTVTPPKATKQPAPPSPSSKSPQASSSKKSSHDAYAVFHRPKSNKSNLSVTTGSSAKSNKSNLPVTKGSSADAGPTPPAIVAKHSKAAKSKQYKDGAIAEESMSYGTFDFDFDLDATHMSYASSEATTTSMSYDFDPFFDLTSMSMPTDDSATANESTIIPIPSEPSFDSDLSRVIFQYLSVCSNMESFIDSCLASKTIDSYANSMLGEPDGYRRLQASSRRVTVAPFDGKARLLLATEPRALSDECGPLDVPTEDTFRSVMDLARKQCWDEERIRASDDEFESLLAIFLDVFANNDCWDHLCDGGSDLDEIFFKLIFNEAAECANVDLSDIPTCALDHIVELFSLVEPEEQDSEPCNQPSQADLGFIVSIVTIDAVSKCGDMGVFLEQSAWNKAATDLVTIFSTSQCWGIGECEDPSEPSLDSPFDNGVGSRVVITDGGYECLYEPDTDPIDTRSIELSFYYKLETVSADPQLLDDSLALFEGALIKLACFDNGRREMRASVEVPRATFNALGRRSLEHDREANVVSINSSPKDVVSSDYACTAESQAVTACAIVEGHLTLTLEGGSPEQDGEFAWGAYDTVEEMFEFLPMLPGDSNVVAIRYLGTEAPSSTTLAEIAPSDEDNAASSDAPNTDITIEIGGPSAGGAQDDSEFNATGLIAASGGVFAMALLIAGFHRMNGEDRAPRPDVEKLDDDKSRRSHDGRSTANQTADLTIAKTVSCDGSSVSDLSAPSPARGLRGLGALPAPDPSPAKYVVLAEAEEAKWRELSILPRLEQDDGTLENVDEEEGGWVNSESDSNSSMSEVSI